MKRVLLGMVFLVGCGGSDGANLFNDSNVQSTALEDAGIDSGNASNVDGSTPSGDVGAQADTSTTSDASPDVAQSVDSSAPDTSSPDTSAPDAGPCGAPCTLPEVCGGSGPPSQCGDKCMTDDSWLPRCHDRGYTTSTWAMPAGCPFTYRVVNGATIDERPNGVTGCNTTELDGGVPIYCCP